MKIWTSTWDAAEGNGIVCYYRREDQPKQRRKTKWACYYWVGPAGHEVWVNEGVSTNRQVPLPYESTKLSVSNSIAYGENVIATVTPLDVLTSTDSDEVIEKLSHSEPARKIDPKEASEKKIMTAGLMTHDSPCREDLS